MHYGATMEIFIIAESLRGDKLIVPGFFCNYLAPKSLSADRQALKGTLAAFQISSSSLPSASYLFSVMSTIIYNGVNMEIFIIAESLRGEKLTVPGFFLQFAGWSVIILRDILPLNPLKGSLAAFQISSYSLPSASYLFSVMSAIIYNGATMEIFIIAESLRGEKLIVPGFFCNLPDGQSLSFAISCP